MGAVAKPETFADKIDALEKRLYRLERQTSLRSASVGEGGLRLYNGGDLLVEDGGNITVEGGDLIVKYDNGNTLLFAGTDDESGSEVFFVGREEGTAAYVMADNIVSMRDRTSLNRIVADDINYGQGLARPYIPVGVFTSIDLQDMRMVTSGVFTSVLFAAGYRQHPKFVGLVSTRSDANTAGEWRIVKNGVVVVPEQPIPNGGGAGVVVLGQQFGANNWADGWAYDSDTNGEMDAAGLTNPGFFEVQVRRTVGAGAVGVNMHGLWGVQS